MPDYLGVLASVAQPARRTSAGNDILLSHCRYSGTTGIEYSGGPTINGA